MASNTAPGQAAGYQYQAEQALLTLIRSRQPRLTLFVEALDDFHIEDEDSALDVVQVKHHLVQRDLSDTSADLWRTLHGWINVFDGLEADQDPSFLLLTTASVAAGSIAELLRGAPYDRDEVEAERRLTALANTDGAETTRSWRDRFASLPEDRRQALVHAITVADAQPNLADVGAALRHEFRPVVREEHLDAFVERLKGWWYERVAHMLTGTLAAVAIEDVWQFLVELRDHFSLDDLPFEYEVPEPTDDEHATYSASTFTHQLRLVDVSEERIKLAIRDYHRAYANTSRWSREGLLLPGELNRYEQRIIDLWQKRFAKMRQDIGSEAAEAIMQEAGRTLWEALDEGISIPPLRPKLDEPTVVSGRLHSLSDDQKVGWHPEFRDRLRELLEAG